MGEVIWKLGLDCYLNMDDSSTLPSEFYPSNRTGTSTNQYLPFLAWKGSLEEDYGCIQAGLFNNGPNNLDDVD